ncbi:RagB/SusD family nutrient uptake outer membrane protein [termite gut metagenome]|uniref:RagB/SusD family nutrient uptake outer membrane protein n=1 Tax=termite gut metagenome TaxID=433724 RepID=A0A5J4SJ88_9ZZZZ
MKTIKYLFLSALFLVPSSCIELEREDYTEIYPENFFQNESDIRLAINSLYATFSSKWGGVYEAGRLGYQVFPDMTTDASWTSWGWEWDQMRFQQWSSTMSGYLSNVINNTFDHYNYLSSARDVIRKIEEAPASDDVKARYAAEAYALRGWMGLYLYDNFGPVPIASDEILDNPEEFVYLPRATEEEYDAFMENDLRKAIEGLPVTASVRGKLTKGAARMILLKYYMIKGYFDKAETLVRELYAMEGSTYVLYPSYNDIFTKENMGNKEIILPIPCNNPNSANYLTAHIVPSDYTWTEKSATYGGYVMPWPFYDTFEQGDDRLKNIVVEYTNTSGKVVKREESGNLIYGAIPLKYGKDPDHSGDMSSVDIVVFRYADVLLTLAECINRNNKQPTAEAIGLVNRVRERVGLAPLSASETATYETFNEAILRERGHEFFYEGLRRQDLIRFGKYAEYANERIRLENEKKGTTYTQVDNTHNRFWIPISIINESKSEIKQNEGYN